ncbi:HAAS signaling domain-containing protein [Kitasatospora sp. NPDC091207]|uniref:HAAS signaling domain-containing protein n=1 Tax=Kitasatospora sp. NPDC091207 TaxID=3364083 RepID=UPI003826021D
MNDTLAHPLVRVFLSSVEQRTAALPEAHRRELLADLREHIAVALAEAGTLDDAGVRRVLDQLGTPAEITAAALAEEPGDQPVAESAGRTVLTVALVAVPLPVGLVPVLGLVLSPVAAVAALVRLWKSRQWSRPEKLRATVLMLSPVLTVPLLAGVVSVASGGLSARTVLIPLLAALVLPVVAAVGLHRSAARLREQRR